jgi:hypothetical protein
MKHLKWFNENASSYPSLEEVESAVDINGDTDHEQICRWYRFLKSPENPEQEEVMNLICKKYKEGGGFNSSLSKKIGFGI